jgi:hypothetical protein
VIFTKVIENNVYIKDGLVEELHREQRLKEEKDSIK